MRTRAGADELSRDTEIKRLAGVDVVNAELVVGVLPCVVRLTVAPAEPVLCALLACDYVVAAYPLEVKRLRVFATASGASTAIGATGCGTNAGSLELARYKTSTRLSLRSGRAVDLGELFPTVLAQSGLTPASSTRRGVARVDGVSHVQLQRNQLVWLACTARTSADRMRDLRRRKRNDGSPSRTTRFPRSFCDASTKPSRRKIPEGYVRAVMPYVQMQRSQQNADGRTTRTSAAPAFRTPPRAASSNVPLDLIWVCAPRRE